MANVTTWMLLQSAVDAGASGQAAPWSNVAGVLAIGGAEASSGPLGFLSADGSQTTRLRVTQPALGGQLPLDFVLLGIEMELRGRWEGGPEGTRTVTVQSVVGAAVRQSLGSCSLPIGASPGVCFKGGPSDPLGVSKADVLTPGFGFQVQGSSTTFTSPGDTVLIDSMRLRVHWDDPVAPARWRGRSRRAFTRGALA